MAVKGTHLTTELDNLLLQYRKIELESMVEMATNLRENATDINEALNEAENFVQILRNLANEVCTIWFNVYRLVY